MKLSKMLKHSREALSPVEFGSKYHIRRKVSRLVVHFFVWVGMAMLYYLGFSIFFDTPVEYEMKRSTQMLAQQYKALNARYDSVSVVLDNLVERDRNLFRILFEAEPYDFDAQREGTRSANHEKLLDKSNRELGNEFFARAQKFEKRLQELRKTNIALEDRLRTLGNKVNNIPSIQPVINKDLTLLTASYGMRIQPFYKSLASHQGVDFTLPEDSRVFATADGTVREVNARNSAGGTTLMLDHGNGYKTEYRHLNKVNVRKGDRVRRGDIIALSGNTGLSLAPHLHYEIIHNDMRVDPVHYFFMELSPTEYQRMIEIARAGMQSFD